ncbi:hypothetical protein M0657_001661 [Pyricularia oryzae]|nr:hypothetical protein M9X92_001085 [Pyricularia oryzae]KAI7930541.1 hypothetical protein M0657_001661 [Pyricularia oryzae]
MRPMLRLLGLRRLHIAAVVVALTANNHFSDGVLSDNLFRPPAIPDDPPGALDNRPIVQLHQQAQAEFQALLARQSRNPDDAETEYRRRYHKHPPPGFCR